MSKNGNLVHLQHIPSVLFQPLNLLPGINLPPALLSLSSNRLLQHSSNIRHRPSGTAQVERSLLLNISLDNITHRLPHAILNVDLFRLVTREGSAEEGEHAGVHVRLPLLAIEVLLSAVTGTEIQENGTNLLALSLLHSAVLDKGTEGSKTGTETGHDQGSRVLGRQLHDRGLDGGDDGGAGLETREVARGLTLAGAALAVNPVDDDNHQSNGSGSDGLSRRDGVLSALERGDDADKVREGWVSRLEGLEDINVGGGVNLGELLELFGTLLAAEELDLLLLSLIGGELGEGLEEALGRLAENVDVLEERLVDGTSLEDGRVLARGDLDKVITVKTVPLNEVLDLLGVVIGVDAERLADVVGEARGAEIELDVEDVAIVGEGSESAVLLDVDGVSLHGEIRAKLSLEAVSLLESKTLGNLLPGADLQSRLSLPLVKGNKAGGLELLYKRDGSGVLLSPGSGNLNLVKGLGEGIGNLNESDLVAREATKLDELLSLKVRASDLQEGKLGKKLRAVLQSGGEGRVKSKELEALLLDLLSDGGRDALLDLLSLEVGQTNGQLAASLYTLDDSNLLEKLLLANENNIRLLDSERSIDWLLGTPDLSADNTTLDEAVVSLVNRDVVERLAREEPAKDGSRGNGLGVVDIPEDVLLGLLKGAQGQGDLGVIVFAGDLAENSGDGAGGVDGGGRVLEINDSRLLRPSIGKGDRSQDIRVEGRLDRGILHSRSITDLAKNGNLANRIREGLEESLFDEWAVDADIESTNLLALSSQSINDLLGKLSLGAAKDNKDSLSGLVTVVLKRSIRSAELAVEQAQKLDNLASGVQPLVQGTSLLGDALVDLGNAGLAERIHHPQSLPGGAETVVDVEGRQKGSQKSGEESHVLDLLSRGGRDETETKVLSQLKGALVLGDEAIAIGVVGSGDVGNEGARDAIEERQLVQGRAQVPEAQRGGKEGLGNAPLAEVKVLGEDVTKRKGAGTGSGLERDNSGGLAMDVLLLGLRPVLDGRIEVEGLGGEGEDLVGKLVSSLLDEELARHVGWAGDGAEGHGLLEAGGDGASLDDRGNASGGLFVLQLHVNVGFGGGFNGKKGGRRRRGTLEGVFKSKDSAAREISRQ